MAKVDNCFPEAPPLFGVSSVELRLWQSDEIVKATKFGSDLFSHVLVHCSLLGLDSSEDLACDNVSCFCVVGSLTTTEIQTVVVFQNFSSLILLNGLSSQVFRANHCLESVETSLMLHDICNCQFVFAVLSKFRPVFCYFLGVLNKPLLSHESKDYGCKVLAGTVDWNQRSLVEFGISGSHKVNNTLVTDKNCQLRIGVMAKFEVGFKLLSDLFKARLHMTSNFPATRISWLDTQINQKCDDKRQ